MTEMWFYTSNGKQMDPVTLLELKRLVGEGSVKPTDMVWKEGMARWIRASSVKELFPDTATALEPAYTHGAKSMEPATAVSPLPAGAAEKETMTPQRKRRPLGEAGDHLGPRGRGASKGGSSVGIVIALILGGGVLVIALAVGGAILLFVDRPADKQLAQPAPPGQFFGNPGVKMDPPPPIDPNTLVSQQAKLYKLRLQIGQEDLRSLSFRKGATYEFLVMPQPNFNVDADIYILSVKEGIELTCDKTEKAGCDLRWTCPEEGQYRVRVHNCPREDLPGGGGAFTCTVSIRETTPPPKIEPPPLPQDVRTVSGSVEIGELVPGKDHSLRVFVKANQKVKFNVTSFPVKGSKPSDIHLFVSKEDGKEIAARKEQTPNPVVEFPAPGAEILTVRVLNSGGSNARCVVYFDLGK